MLEKIEFPPFYCPTLATVITGMDGSARFFKFFFGVLSLRPSLHCGKIWPQVSVGRVVSLRHRYLKCSVLKTSQGSGSQYIIRERQR